VGACARWSASCREPVPGGAPAVKSLRSTSLARAAHLEAGEGQLEAGQQAGVEAREVGALRGLQLWQRLVVVPHAVLCCQPVGLHARVRALVCV